MNVPLLRLELDGIKEQIGSMIVDRNQEITSMILEEINKQITEEWVFNKVRGEVRKALEHAIDGIADNYRVTSAIRDQLGEYIADKIFFEEPK